MIANIAKLKIPFLSGFILHLPPELTPYQVAAEVDAWAPSAASVPNSAAVDADELASREAIPRFQAALLDALRNDNQVREARMYLNALVGWERLLILTLAFWFVTLAIVRTIQALPHEAHAIEIRDHLKGLQKDWQRHFPAASARLGEANTLLQRLTGDSSTTSRLVTIPSTLVRAAVDEMKSRLSAAARPTRSLNMEDGALEGTAQAAIDSLASQLRHQALTSSADTRAIETAAEGLRSKLNHSRLIFEALLPTFPAIGFVGTVTSLLVAMSKADQIVKATDALARGAATSAVTDVLSLCFAATLMALVCLIVLAPLSLWQSAREQRLVDSTEHLLQDVLKPEQR